MEKTNDMTVEIYRVGDTGGETIYCYDANPLEGWLNIVKVSEDKKFLVTILIPQSGIEKVVITDPGDIL
ncbi:MAG: hypothetical protein M0R17_01855 [Candidatus Omnitrophica bacterium]|jgi:hypothetical protein|nr:hypothetical protein [Candidatus Omnitrophota bacterium]